MERHEQRHNAAAADNPELSTSGFRLSAAMTCYLAPTPIAPQYHLTDCLLSVFAITDCPSVRCTD